MKASRIVSHASNDLMVHPAGIALLCVGLRPLLFPAANSRKSVYLGAFPDITPTPINALLMGGNSTVYKRFAQDDPDPPSIRLVVTATDEHQFPRPAKEFGLGTHRNKGADGRAEVV